MTNGESSIWKDGVTTDTIDLLNATLAKKMFPHCRHVATTERTVHITAGMRSAKKYRSLCVNLVMRISLVQRVSIFRTCEVRGPLVDQIDHPAKLLLRANWQLDERAGEPELVADLFQDDLRVRTIPNTRNAKMATEMMNVPAEMVTRGK